MIWLAGASLKGFCCCVRLSAARRRLVVLEVRPKEPLRVTGKDCVFASVTTDLLLCFELLWLRFSFRHFRAPSQKQNLHNQLSRNGFLWTDKLLHTI